jgi:uncharacterized protein
MTTTHALVVRGGWDGHDPVGTTDLFIPYLREQGFDVRVESDTAVYADEVLMRDVDLVVQCVTMSTIDPSHTAGLRAAVERGTGLAGWHGGIVDAFRADADYLQLVGGQFAHHAVRDDRSTATQPYTVRMTAAAREHPVTTGIDDFDLDTELYWVLTDDYSEVLATVTQPARPFDPWHRPVVSPAIWTRSWGDGRVFVVTPGHSVADFDSPLRAVVERGMVWAARDRGADGEAR